MTTPTSNSSQIQRELTCLQNLVEASSNPSQLHIFFQLAKAKEEKLKQNPSSLSADRVTTSPLLSEQILTKIDTIRKQTSSASTYQPQNSAISTITTFPKPSYPSIYPTTTHPSNHSTPKGITRTTPLPEIKKVETKPTQQAEPIQAVGFANLSNNCWCGSLLQMVIHIPSLRKAYKTVAQFYIANGDNQEQQHGQALLQALSQYKTSLPKHIAILPSVSQAVRLALNCFFPDNINPSQGRQEDAHEAMQLLMGRYEWILSQEQLPLKKPLYTPIATKKIYEPQANPRPADPNKLWLTQVNPTSNDAYTRLAPDYSTTSVSCEYQVFLDLEGSSNHPAFSQLLSSYFDTRDGGSGQSPVYLRPNDDQIEDFKLKQEIRQFQDTPEELFVIVKRFGFDPINQKKSKIMTPLDVPREFRLPPEATTTGLELTYVLDSFIVHRGDANGGHYIAYRLLEKGWIECDDGAVRPISEQDIDNILHNRTGSRMTGYIHHYKLKSQAVPMLVEPLSKEASKEEINTPFSTASSSSTAMSIDIKPLIPTQNELSELKTTKASLEKLKDLLQDQSTLRTTINQHLETLPKEVMETLIFLISVDKSSLAPNYGATMLQYKPRLLLEINFPWISLKGTNSIEQLIALYDLKIQKDQDTVEKEILITYLNLSQKQVQNRQLTAVFDQLDIRPHVKEKLVSAIPGGEIEFRRNPSSLFPVIEFFLNNN